MPGVYARSSARVLEINNVCGDTPAASGLLFDHPIHWITLILFTSIGVSPHTLLISNTRALERAYTPGTILGSFPCHWS